MKNLSAVSRTFTILEKLSLVSSSNLEDLAKATGLAKPTVYRFLLTLRDLGYIHRDEGEKWYLTMRLFSVGSRALDHIELPAVARPVAVRLSAELGETVHMGILDDGEVLYVLKIESRYTIRMYSRVGRKIPLYCSAMGKTLLAHMSSIERDALLGELELVPFTPNTIKNRKKLEHERSFSRQSLFFKRKFEYSFSDWWNCFYSFQEKCYKEIQNVWVFFMEKNVQVLFRTSRRVYATLS